MRYARDVSTVLRFYAISGRLSFCLAALMFCNAGAMAQTNEFQPTSPAGPSPSGFSVLR